MCRLHWQSGSTLRPVLVLSLAVFALAGCRKKQLPSEHYTQAHELFTKLYGAQLDDAFADPQMTVVEQWLQRVPQDSLDFANAQELSQRITEGRKRIAAAEAARRAAIQAVATAPYQRMVAVTRSAEPPAPTAADAGWSQPAAHMPLTEFARRFSDCFRSSDRVNVIGQGMLDSWELKDIANCRDRHPGFDKLLVLSDAHEVAVTVDKSLLEWRLPDGGLPSQQTSAASSSTR